jgi:hypothetical protein
MQVSQSFLDLLNGESEKMTAALQNPANHDRIIKAGCEAEIHLGVSPFSIVPGGAVPQAEAERILGERLPPEHIYPAIGGAVTVEVLPDPWWKRILNRIFRAVGMSLFAAAILGPTPQLQLQQCNMTIKGNVITVRCDSSKVCPPGYALQTLYSDNLNGSNLSEVFGFGDAFNECLKTHAIRKITQSTTELLP